MKICISAESTIDLPQDLLDKYDIKTTPFSINFNNRLEEDRFGIASEIFEFVDKTKILPKTSAVSPGQFKEHFTKLKKDYDVIIHFSMSSKLSCAYNNACLVASEMEGVYIIDTLSLSTGIALLAIQARELIEKNLSPEEIVTKVKEMVEKVRVSLVVDKLNYMHKGGRCSTIALLGANLLKIRPRLNLIDGKLIVGNKYRGVLKKVINNYIDDLIKEMDNADKSMIFITHSSSMPEDEKIVMEKLKNAGFKTVYNTDAGGTISSHCGPNCMGILYLDK